MDYINAKSRIISVMLKVNIEISFSKLMSLLVLGCSVAMDILQKSNTATMFALPFVVTLITGKQFIDYKKKQE